MLAAQENLRSINEARRENDVDGTNKEDEDPQLPGQAMSAMEDMQEMNAKSANDLSGGESKCSMLTREKSLTASKSTSSTRSSMKTTCANVPLSL